MSRFSPRDWLPSGRTLAVVPPFAWLVLFLLVPFLLVFKISFAELKFGIPPYTALAEFKDEAVQFSLHPVSYTHLDVYKRQAWAEAARGAATAQAARIVAASQDLRICLLQGCRYFVLQWVCGAARRFAHDSGIRPPFRPLVNIGR